MVADHTYALLFLLLVASTAVPSSLAAPAPAPAPTPAPRQATNPAPVPFPAYEGVDYDLGIKEPHVVLGYRVGRFGKAQDHVEYSIRERDGEYHAHHDIDLSRSGRTVYDIALLDAPDDTYCRFEYGSSRLPEWIPGQERDDNGGHRREFSRLRPLFGAIKNVRRIYCVSRIPEDED